MEGQAREAELGLNHSLMVDLDHGTEVGLDCGAEVGLDHGAEDETMECKAVDKTIEDRVAMVEPAKMGTTRVELVEMTTVA